MASLKSLRLIASIFFGLMAVAAFFVAMSNMPESGANLSDLPSMKVLLNVIAFLAYAAGGVLWFSITFGFEDVYELFSTAFLVGFFSYMLVAIVANAQYPFFLMEPAEAFVKIVFTIVFPIYAIVDRFWYSRN